MRYEPTRCPRARGAATLTVAFALLLAACDNPKARPDDAPELGTWGVTTDDMDSSVEPGDNFFRYVNGQWLDTFEIPADYSRYGSFTVLRERSEEQVRTIAEDAARADEAGGDVAADVASVSSEEEKIGLLYSTYLDTLAIEAKGYSTVASDLAAIDALQSPADVARAFGNTRLTYNLPVAAFVNVDAKRTDEYSVYLTQAGLGMPNREYYVDEKLADKRPKYLAYIEGVLGLAGIDGAAAKAQAIMDLEMRMAAVHWEPAKRRDRDLTYNPMSRAELNRFAPEMPWDAMFDQAGLGGQSDVIVRESDAIQELAKIFAETPVATWRAYLKFHLLNSNTDVLPAELDDANFAFFQSELRGTPEQRDRWKRGVSAINGAMGEAVGQVYVERHFPADSKKQMEALVANLRLALDERIKGLPWMGEDTKVEALDKLEKFTPKIAYPDKWRDYTNLVVTDDAYENAQNARAFAWAYSISRLGGPVDKTEWGMTPQTVNAYYAPPRNEIVFPAGILQPPFFDPNADPAVNYGGIGAVIGHEMGHGFDDQGRKSDGDGVLRDWWTEADAASFQKLADMIGEQYAQFEPVPGFNVNPKLTMGENIGDIGGLAMAYHAYKLSLHGEEAPVIDGFTGDQRFFMAWAQVWKGLSREEALKNQVTTDPHSPAEYRVNGVVRNMDAWYAAFDVTEGDDMYLAPDSRVRIW